MNRFLVPSGLGIALALGCGDTVTTTTTQTLLECDSDEVAACVCEDGQVGRRECVDGGLSACECPSPLRDGVCRTDLDCSDGRYCNGRELCAPEADGADERGCVDGEPPDCDDGIDCTVDSCSPELNGCTNRAPDTDEDGHPDQSCQDAEGQPLGDDCDDDDANRYPGNLEVCDLAAPKHDEDCDPTTVGARDRDGDGETDDRCCNGDTCGSDCDDGRIAVRSGQPEFCDNRDNDCDGSTDEDAGPVAWHHDDDGDGFGGDYTEVADGDDKAVVESCRPVPGRSLLASDCRDDDPAQHPAQIEVCDLRDQNCNMLADENARCPYEGFPVDALPGAGVDDVPVPDAGMPCGMFAYPDVDGDGYGDSMAAMSITGEGDDCGVPTGMVTRGGDCDDSLAEVNPGPGVVDVCNLQDDDCDGVVDNAVEADESCALPNTNRTCAFGVCQLASEDTCPDANHQDCDAQPDNGCETDVRTSANNCGSCGMTCALGDACVDSTCADTPVDALVAGYDFTLALRAGQVVGWGTSNQGELGTSGPQSVAPQPVNSLRGVSELAVGGDNVCARVGGSVYCWGGGQSLPSRVPGIDDAVGIGAAKAAACAVRADGSVWCWGSDQYHELTGTGATAESDTPLVVSGVSDAIQVSGNQGVFCALQSAGTVMCWGDANEAKLGIPDSNGTNNQSPLPTAPVTIPGFEGVERLGRTDGYGNHMCAVMQSGSVRCWGSATQGVLGNGTSSVIYVDSPTAMPGIAQATEVALGTNHTCVRTQTGELLCTGNDGYAQILGTTGSGQYITTPVNVDLGGETVQGIALGHEHTCLLLTSGSIACQGRNNGGQLGRVTMTAANDPNPRGLVAGFP